MNEHTHKVTSVQEMLGTKGINLMRTMRKRHSFDNLGKEYYKQKQSRCKGPEVAISIACLRDRKKTSVMDVSIVRA